jgi:hypothetical protein
MVEVKGTLIICDKQTDYILFIDGYVLCRRASYQTSVNEREEVIRAYPNQFQTTFARSKEGNG